MVRSQILTTLLVFFYVLKYVLAFNLTYATSLQNTLMTNYRKEVLPSLNYAAVINVSVSYNLVGINEFDAVSSKFSITGYFVVTWIDPRMSWDTANYGGIYMTSFHQKNMWVPELMLTTGYSEPTFIGSDTQPVTYEYPGSARWQAANIIDSICDADVTYYPFDTHKCKVQFINWGGEPSMIKFSPSADTISLADFVEQPMWRVMSTKMTTRDNIIVELYITFQRRPSYFIVNTIVPILSMCILNLFAFIIPAESGERIGFSITILLAIAVYLSIVADTLPATSNPSIALICYMLVIDMVISILITACTILSLRFYLREENDNELPGWTGTFTRVLNRCQWRKQTKVRATDDRDKAEEGKRLELHIDHDVTWKDVSFAFDKLSLIIFLFLLSSTNLAFIIYLWNTV